MDQKFELVVDGKVRGEFSLIMTPIGIGVMCSGDVEFRPIQQQQQEPGDEITLRDLRIARRLMAN